jgi:16S rRNA (uracil1498-N3)-methyltransferase
VTVHRFFLPPESFESGQVTFPREISHQLTRVLRLRSGDRVIALDGSGTELTVRLDALGGIATGIVEERRQNDAEPRIRLVLYQALLKGPKFEVVLQKGTEIGVSEFRPIVTERSVRAALSTARRRRYAEIVRESAEQSRRGILPPVAEPCDLALALRRAASEGPVLFLWEEEKTARLTTVIAAVATDSVALFVGPEGGFTDQEAALALDQGALICTLGRRMLRAETAAIVGAALLLARHEDLG